MCPFFRVNQAKAISAFNTASMRTNEQSKKKEFTCKKAPGPSLER